VLLHAAIQHVYKVHFASKLTPYCVKAEILKACEEYDLEIASMSKSLSYLIEFVNLFFDLSTSTSRADKFKLRAPRVGLCSSKLIYCQQ
jgi:hypothetical protein